MKTTDGGKTWTDASQGLPAPEFRGRIGIDIARSKPDTLYAFVDNYEIGRVPPPGSARRVRTADAAGPGVHQGRGHLPIGRRRQDVASDEPLRSGDARLSGQSLGHVRLGVRTDPRRSDESENTIYTLGSRAERVDGRRQDVRGVARHARRSPRPVDRSGQHADHLQQQRRRLLQSSDAGQTWKFAVAAGGAQFYNVEVDTSPPPWAYGSIQDHGSRRGRIDLEQGRRCGAAGRVRERARRRGIESRRRSDQPEHRLLARVLRKLQPHRSRRAGGPAARRPAARARETPIQPDGSRRRTARAVDGAIHHLAARQQHRLRRLPVPVQVARTAATTWEKISPDLTDNNRRQMGENPSAIPYQTIIAMAESPKKKDLLYVGTDDGRLHTTIDGGKEWTELTTKLPVRRWISRVTPSRTPTAPSTSRSAAAKTTTSRPTSTSPRTSARRSRASRTTFRPGPVNVIREDPRNAERAVRRHGLRRVRLDERRREVGRARRQSAVRAGVRSADRERDNIIVVSTYGRGMWVLDAVKIGGRPASGGPR